MITVGIDLSSEATNRTATCRIRWDGGGSASVESLREQVSMAEITTALGDPSVDKVGVDVPLGWPRAFVDLVAEHDSHQRTRVAPINHLRLRETDRWIQSKASVRDLPRKKHDPASVSASYLGVPAMRFAQEARVRERSGTEEVVEVYPSSALKEWGFPYKGYKRGKEGPNVRRAIVTGVRSAIPLMRQHRTRAWDRMIANDDVIDAFVAALVARARALGKCPHGVSLVHPIPDKNRSDARREGWIALPTHDSLAHLAC
jgi:predicted nuclease with RNAse H fold